MGPLIFLYPWSYVTYINHVPFVLRRKFDFIHPPAASPIMENHRLSATLIFSVFLISVVDFRSSSPFPCSHWKLNINVSLVIFADSYLIDTKFYLEIKLLRQI